MEMEEVYPDLIKEIIICTWISWETLITKK